MNNLFTYSRALVESTSLFPILHITLFHNTFRYTLLNSSFYHENTNKSSLILFADHNGTSLNKVLLNDNVVTDNWC